MSLTPRWTNWRRKRFRVFLSEGLPRGLAWQVAEAEAKMRSRLSAAIGLEAARDARLTFVRRNDQISFGITGSLSPLTDKQAAAVERLGAKLLAM